MKSQVLVLVRLRILAIEGKTRRVMANKMGRAKVFNYTGITAEEEKTLSNIVLNYL